MCSFQNRVNACFHVVMSLPSDFPNHEMKPGSQCFHFSLCNIETVSIWEVLNFLLASLSHKHLAIEQLHSCMLRNNVFGINMGYLQFLNVMT